MPPLRIVLLLPELPLPFGGAAARWYYVMIRALLEAGQHLTVLAPFDRPADASAARDLFPQLDLHAHATTPRRGPLAKIRTLHHPFSYQFSPAFLSDLRELMAGPVDLLHVEHLPAARLALPWADRALANIHYLFAIDWAGAHGGSVYDRLIRHAALRAERSTLRQLRHVTALTPRLAEAAAAINPSLRPHVVPMALDLSLYPFQSTARAHDAEPVVGLIGSFHWKPGIDAGTRLLTRLWPAILDRVPNARLQIVGRRAAQALAHLPPPPRTQFHSDVPDTLPFFHSTDVLLYAPGIASGMKVKVMEGFALGTAVVTNDQGVEGLPVIDAVHAAIANDDQTLIHRTVELLTDPAKRQAQCVAARRLLETACTPQFSLDALLAAYKQIVPRLHAPS